MRSDMGRVVIERPRIGSSSRSLKVRRVGKIHLDEDGYDYDGPVRVPSSGAKMHAINKKIREKAFSDLLGPIDGYLKSSTGRPWDDVYSEIARNLGAFSWPLQHIMRQHIDVETNTYLGVDGRIYAENKRGNAEIALETTNWFRRHEFYVHPITRVLCATKLVKAARPKPILNRVKIDDTRWFVFIKGLWFIGAYRKSEFIGVLQSSRRGWNIEYGGVDWPSYQVTHGKDQGAYIFSVIKQASKKEIKLLRRLQADERRRV